MQRKNEGVKLVLVVCLLVLMVVSGDSVSELAKQEVYQWLENLREAPEYHPTLAEFRDPMGYIFKIEEEAGKYGICKIVPPVLRSTRKTTISNLNRSLVARGGSSKSGSGPTFTTRQQQVGVCSRKSRPVERLVWQSGESYTFNEFAAKAKSFTRNYLKKSCKKDPLSSLEIETLYWKAACDKPFSVEYANDMPGSAFSAKKHAAKVAAMNEGVTVGETEWNMRGVSRAKGSLLRFMKEEIPGVTFPMVYLAMLFSWFAWHVEDHDFHSLNYLHMGAAKTWYGVPREAAIAFEEVVRVHGYGEEISPLVTLAVLCEKTTVMSPEVFIAAGVPCCRLVQNAGEFVVTFPRAYHSGFSHGFNCAEAANIATPEWLKVAKDAAIRRAAINYSPMVSHFQLLYDFALELCTRLPARTGSKPRSSRQKGREIGEGERLVKELFVKNVTQTNNLLHVLGKGSSVVILPQTSSDIPSSAKARVGSHLRVKPTLGLCHHKGSIRSSVLGINQVESYSSLNRNFSISCEMNGFSAANLDGCSHDVLSNQRLFSCVSCGIVIFGCLAVIQPSKTCAKYLMSVDCSFLNEWSVGSRLTSSCSGIAASPTRSRESIVLGDLYEVPIQFVDHDIQIADHSIKLAPPAKQQEEEASALRLLALAYGTSSDSEESELEADDDLRYTDRIHLNGFLNGPVGPCNLLLLDSLHKIPIRTVDFSIDGTDELQRDDVFFSTEFRNWEDSYDGRRSRAMGSQRPFEDSSRVHIFCLEHALEVKRQLDPIGGACILLLCHPDYPRIEDEAKLVSEELGIRHFWNKTTFRNATGEEDERIQSALDSEEAMPENGDWSVKLGIDLFYSACLSQCPLYSNQMPHNSVIHNTFFGTRSFARKRKRTAANRRIKRRRGTEMEKLMSGLCSCYQYESFVGMISADSTEPRAGEGRRNETDSISTDIADRRRRRKTRFDVLSDGKKKNSQGKGKGKGKGKGEYECDVEGCNMGFGSKQDLAMHKRNICPNEGCGKKFFSHKYLAQHRRVHLDERPLKCPWKGCNMAFKWAWARTEHLRVHTGARPYVCSDIGCGQSFRFVSDFSRHKRKTGHSLKKKKMMMNPSS